MNRTWHFTHDEGWLEMDQMDPNFLPHQEEGEFDQATWLRQLGFSPEGQWLGREDTTYTGDGVAFMLHTRCPSIPHPQTPVEGSPLYLVEVTNPGGCCEYVVVPRLPDLVVFMRDVCVPFMQHRELQLRAELAAEEVRKAKIKQKRNQKDEQRRHAQRISKAFK